MKIKLLLLLVTLLVTQAQAQIGSYSGLQAFDGEHKNVASGYVMGGKNVVSGNFGGLAVSYTRHFTPRWHLGADAQAQFGKQLYSIDARGGYRLPVKRFKTMNFYFDGRLHYNRYSRWNFNEVMFNLSVLWESAYVDIRVGESIIHYQSLGDGYTEPLTLTFGIGANVRPRNNPWNIGLFFRNYDDFYYENWNINWGLRFYVHLPRRVNLFGEFNVRPAGSISQLATRYEGSVKLGLKYDW